jgi:hypothetical protein
MRPDTSPLVPDDAADLDHLTDTGDVSNMVPV